jgi:hypothetical protein
MATQTWLAASAGSAARPGQINQFLGSHSSAWLYSGNTLQSHQTTGSAEFQSSDGQYMAQTFTTASTQTTVGQVLLQISTVGGSPITALIPALTVAVYANSGGVPTGSALGSATVTSQYVYTSPFWVQVPLGLAGLSVSTPYQLVVSAAGTATNHYAWQQSNQTSGASVSPDGLSWSAQSFGLMYQVYDQSGQIWPPLSLIDDDGARVTTFAYNSLVQLTGITESVVSQDGSSFFSSRTISYSGQYPTGVS